MRQVSLGILLLAAVVSLSCHPRSSAGSLTGGLPECTPRVPANAMRATDSAIAGLAGTYDLIMVNTVGGWMPAGPHRVELELSLNPPERRAGWPPRTLGRVPGPRPLSGRLRFNTPDQSVGTASVHRDVPQVEVIGSVLYFGSPDVVDGGGDRLSITHVAATGFWGTWDGNLGIAMVMDTVTGKALPDPEGWFCGYRRASSAFSWAPNKAMELAGRGGSRYMFS